MYRVLISTSRVITGSVVRLPCQFGIADEPVVRVIVFHTVIDRAGRIRGRPDVQRPAEEARDDDIDPSAPDPGAGCRTFAP